MQNQNLVSRKNGSMDELVYICHKRSGLFWGGFKTGWIKNKVRSLKFPIREAEDFLKNINYARIIK
ncbi:MAG: hypothetical protein D8M58_20920 [Calditrichaeota bacterium]|nr:MAG: hypothetical protein DWQ03_16635 [Calditrichota bacterium]MBL1207874.1 hypothetical protein [Calditrichota bacterium]NOG47709.1 hypothetical protein [Calditrichota bacterium]